MYNKLQTSMQIMRNTSSVLLLHPTSTEQSLFVRQTLNQKGNNKVHIESFV